MKVHRFTEHDKQSTDKWFEKQGMAGFKTEPSKIGFIVKGVCACFMLQAENGVVIIDSLVTNPTVSGLTRNVAIDAMINEFKLVAASKGYTRIIAWTANEGTLQRAIRHGFSVHSHALMSLEVQ